MPFEIRIYAYSHSEYAKDEDEVDIITDQEYRCRGNLCKVNEIGVNDLPEEEE